MINLNNVKITGDYNIVIQNADGSIQTIVFDEFIKKFTFEKDARIKVLEDTLQDKKKIETLSDSVIADLQNKLGILNREKAFLETQIQSLLKEFINHDISQADVLYQKAFNLFINGQLEEAIEVLDEKELLKQEAELKIKQENQAKTRLLKAQLLSLEFKFDDAGLNIEKMVGISPTWRTYFEAGCFYGLLGDYKKGKDNFEKALKLASDGNDKCVTLANLAGAYTKLELFKNAEDAYNESLTIRRSLAEGDPLNPYQVALILDALGTLKNINNRFPEAIVHLEEARVIIGKITENIKDVDYYRILISILETLGNVYTNVRRYSKAEAAYRDALYAFDNLFSLTPQRLIHDVYTKGTLLINMGYFYSNSYRRSEAMIRYAEALTIFRKLVSNNPRVYNPDLALLLNNMGNLFGSNKDFKHSLELLNESLSIRRVLMNENPQTYSAAVADTLNNLGILYKMNSRVNEAEKSYMESMNIYKKLAASNPQIYQLELAGLSVNMSIFYFEILPDKIKSLSLATDAIRNAYPYVNAVPIAKEYIGGALGLANRWKVNIQSFFDNAIRIL